MTGRVAFRALGTGCVVLTTDAAALDEAHAVVVDELAAIDAACSRFRPDSDLMRVNAHSGRPVAVSDRLLDAVDVAVRAASLTDGDLDPTIGTALVSLGYDRDFAHIGPRAAGQVRVQRVAGWHCVRVDRARRTVAVPYGVRIDLGATAKAWAADRAAAFAAASTGCGVLVSLGGDISVAGAAPSAGWRIALADAHDAPVPPDGPAVTIHDGGVATSSTTARRWTLGSTVMHHILDPRTGLPVTDLWRTVSVAAATAVDANIASTTCIIRAADALQWLEHIALPARLVNADGSVATVNGWPAEDRERTHA